MTYFPNFGLLNNMGQHLANVGTPKILDYDIDNRNGYTYTPTPRDLVASPPIPTNNNLNRQQRFNEAINNILYSQSQVKTNVANDIFSHNPNLKLQNEKVLNSLVTPDYRITEDVSNVNVNNNLPNINNGIVNTNVNQNLNTQNDKTALNEYAPVTKVEDVNNNVNKDALNKPKENFDLKPDETPSQIQKHRMTMNLVIIAIVMFVVFMLIQLYLNQKKLEFLMDLTARQNSYERNPYNERNFERNFEQRREPNREPSFNRRQNNFERNFEQEREQSRQNNFNENVNNDVIF